MKTQHTDTPIGPSPLRRKLLLSLPGGLALATPFALIGCGGGDDASTDTTTPPPGGGIVITDPPGPLTATTMSVQIQLPDAIAAAAGALRVSTSTGTANVSANSADVAVIADGPQLVSVIDANGNIVALGWAGKNQPAITPQSTAAVLLTFGLGLPFLGNGARDSLRTRLQTQPAVATFGDRIAAELLANPKALSSMSAGIVDGFVQATDALLPAAAVEGSNGRMRALGLVIEPGTEQSGLQVVQGETLNTFFVDNAYMRRAVVILNREGYVDSAGADHPDPATPVQVGEVMDLPLPAAIDSVANVVVGGWANEYYAPDDPNGFWRSVTDPVTLEITPSDAKRTRYSVVVLTAGKLPPTDAAQFARLPASQQAYITGLDLNKNLVLQMLLLDFLAPMFFEFLSSRIGAGGKKPVGAAAEADAAVLKAFAAQMLSILQNRVPDLTQKLTDGSIDGWTAFKTILKACTVDPATGEVSPLLQEFLTQGALLCAKALADAGLRSRMLEVATGFQFGNNNVLGILPVLKIIGIFDTVLGKLAQLRIVRDFERSSRMVSWRVAATKAKVVLRPDPVVVNDTVPVPVKVEIVDNDNDAYGVEKGSFRFDWVCTGLYGDLLKRNGVAGAPQEKNKFSTSNANPTTDYLARTMDDNAGPEKITVTAYFEPIGSSQPAELIGTASATLQFKKAFSLKITPVTTDLNVNSSIGVTATLNEELPDNADARFEFSMASGGGTIGLTGTDSDTRHAYVEYRSPADETTAAVECVAVIRTGGREIRTDPVRATIQVKKGLKTIEVEGNWVYESGTKPLAAPSCFYDAGGTQVCQLGYLDDWVIYQIPKVTDAVSYSIRLLAADGSERVRYGYPNGNYASSVLDGGGVFRIRYWAADGPYGSSGGVSNYPTIEANARAYLLSRVATDGPRIVATVTLKS